VLHIVDLVGDRARAHAFEQGRHAAGMAQAGAVVHIVGTKTGAHQLLEQIGFFVAALGRAKTGQRFSAIGITQALSGPAASANASSHVASRNTSDQSAVLRFRCCSAAGSLGTPALRTSGTVRRCGLCA
jgi:hypothetical protein